MHALQKSPTLQRRASPAVAHLVISPVPSTIRGRNAAIGSRIGGTTSAPAFQAPRLSERTPGVGFRKGVLRPARAATGGPGVVDPGEEIKKHSLAAVLLAVGAACAGAFAFGYHMAVVNGLLDAMASDLGFAARMDLQGFVVSSTLAGAAISSLLGGGLVDALGRRKTLLLASVSMVLGPLLTAYATGFQQAAIGRFLAGVAIGLSSSVVPTYISEVAPTYIRGTLGTLNQLVICLGILAVSLVKVSVPPTEWRQLFLLSLVPAALLLLGMLASPESPRWLQAKGQFASAQATSRRLWGPTGDFELGATPATSAKQQEAGWADAFSPQYRRGVIMGIVLFAIQQFAGINAIIIYSTEMFKQAGVASDYLASAAAAGVNVLGTVLAASLIEAAGRKQLLVGSYLGQAATMSVMAAACVLPALKAYSSTLAVVVILAYILSFALGSGPITALIISELNPGAIRGRAMALAFTSHWVCSVALGQTYKAIVSQYGVGAVYATFGVVALLGAFYINSQVPETKGKTFEQIATELNA